jgi:hypothetical protein
MKRRSFLASLVALALPNPKTSVADSVIEFRLKECIPESASVYTHPHLQRKVNVLLDGDDVTKECVAYHTDRPDHYKWEWGWQLHGEGHVLLNRKYDQTAKAFVIHKKYGHITVTYKDQK